MLTQPTILNSAVLDSLNHLAYSSCGCFFFLEPKPPVPYPQPSDYQDAFFLNIVRLYILYKDCGRKFLPLCLSAAFQPPKASTQMLIQRRKAEKHYENIRGFMRAYYCHANFQIPDRKNFSVLINNSTITKMNNWLAHTTPNNLSNWKGQYNRLLNDANGLYNYLSEWITQWNTQPDVEKKELIRKFAYYSVSGVDTQKVAQESLSCPALSSKPVKSALEASLDTSLFLGAICRLRSVSYERAKDIYAKHIDKLLTFVRNIILKHDRIPNTFYEMIMQQAIKAYSAKPQSSIDVFKNFGLDL